jgi:hypothetical protein
MTQQRLSRKLEPTEIPQDVNESLPEALTVNRRPPDDKPSVSGTKELPGEEQYEPAPTREVTPELVDPPRGQKPSGSGGQ